MIRVGLAGFSQGYYATEYMSYLERFKEISVAAVCDCGESEEYVKECAFTTAQTFSEKMKLRWCMITKSFCSVNWTPC